MFLITWDMPCQHSASGELVAQLAVHATAPSLFTYHVAMNCGYANDLHVWRSQGQQQSCNTYSNCASVKVRVLLKSTRVTLCVVNSCIAIHPQLPGLEGACNCRG